MRKIKNHWVHKEGYDCFGCSPDNPLGVKMEFYEDGDDIVCFWSGVTNRLEVKYRKSIMTTEPQITIRARLTEMKRQVAFIHVEIYNSMEELCTEGEAVYFTMSQEKAREMGFTHCECEDQELLF